MMPEASSAPSAPVRTGIVLSGGGADGAYAVGVLKALLSGRSPANGFRILEPDVFAGTSIGSFNASYLVSRWHHSGVGAVGELEGVWLEKLADRGACGNGAFRIRADPTRFFDPACYLPNPTRPFTRFARDSAALSWDFIRRLVHFAGARDPLLPRSLDFFNFSSFVSREPWAATIRDSIDFQAIRNSDRALRVVATNWSTGRLRVFENRHLSEGIGARAIEASSALPGFFEAVAVGSQLYVDGAVLQNTPLKPAIEAGASEIYIIYLDPDISAVPLAEQESTLETLYRMQQIAWASAIASDTAAARRINEFLSLVAAAEQLPATSDAVAELARKYARYRPLTVHRFSPQDDLGGALGLLNLGLSRVERLVEQGFEEATRHDCATAGCILVPDVGESAEASP